MTFRRLLVLMGLLALVACTTTTESASQPSRVGSSTLVVPTSTQVPTSTPNPDSDDDGLTDIQERELGTNPFQRDSDVDGLDDEAEVRLGSDPLFPDTDRDGHVDCDDSDPLNDLAVELTLLSFTDHTQRAILSFFDSLDAYLVLSVDDQQVKIPFDYFKPVTFDVPDDSNKAKVSVRAYEGEGGSEALTRELISGIVPILRLFEPTDELYDISSASGKAGISQEIELKVGGQELPALVGNGLEDGVFDDHSRFQAEVEVRIRVGGLTGTQ